MSVDAHPVRDGLNLLDGSWHAADPHEIWTWMRREAPVYQRNIVGERTLDLPREPNPDQACPSERGCDG